MENPLKHTQNFEKRSDEFEKLKEEIEVMDGGLVPSHLSGANEFIIQTEIEAMDESDEKHILEGLFDKRMVEVWQTLIDSIQDPVRGSGVHPQMLENTKFFDPENKSQILKEYEEKMSSFESQ